MYKRDDTLTLKPWHFLNSVLSEWKRLFVVIEMQKKYRKTIEWKDYRPWYWEKFKAGGEGNDRGWDGWTASPTQWTWVWVGSGSWWWTRRPGVLQSMGLQRVRHNWANDLNWHISSGKLEIPREHSMQRWAQESTKTVWT